MTIVSWFAGWCRRNGPRVAVGGGAIGYGAHVGGQELGALIERGIPELGKYVIHWVLRLALDRVRHASPMEVFLFVVAILVLPLPSMAFLYTVSYAKEKLFGNKREEEVAWLSRKLLAHDVLLRAMQEELLEQRAENRSMQAMMHSQDIFLRTMQEELLEQTTEKRNPLDFALPAGRPAVATEDVARAEDESAPSPPTFTTAIVTIENASRSDNAEAVGVEMKRKAE